MYASLENGMETLEQRIARVVQEDVVVVPYDAIWPELFRQEKEHLLSCLPVDLIRRIEHFGSTAVPGLSAKPIVDMLVEVTSLDETKWRIVPILESQGYNYFWRPTWGDDVPPWYAWFIKRDGKGARTHHIHMVQRDFEHWDRLLFRNYLIEHPDAALEYQTLKLRLANAYPNDRVEYTRAKTEFIVRVTEQAKRLYTVTPGE
ncbi:MAG: GrpB family protein [Thermoguttaceae bacterium]